MLISENKAVTKLKFKGRVKGDMIDLQGEIEKFNKDLSEKPFFQILVLVRKSLGLLVVFAAVVGCATTQPAKIAVQAPVAMSVLEEAQKEQISQATQPTLKRKVAIGRFTNESRYGRGLLVDADNDPLGKSLSDILSARLIQSGKFLLVERTDLGKIAREQSILSGGSGAGKAQINVSKESGKDDGYRKEISLSNPVREELKVVGADALIIGSLTEFSRRAEGKAGFLSGTKLQVAEAKVDIRLVDPRNGLAFFSVSGSGKANSESGTVAGFGSKSSYDSSLNDEAIGAAISDLIGELIGKLESRPWRAGILKIQGNQVFVSGGERQGLKIGDELIVYRENESITSDRGFAIQLPPSQVGKIKVVSFFGDSEVNEGAVASITEGSFSQASEVYVAEK